MTLLATENQRLEDGRARAGGPKKYAPERGILDEAQRQGTAACNSTTDNDPILAAGRNLTGSSLTLLWVFSLS